MSSACVKAWVKIPKLDTVCVQRSATISIEEHNKAHPHHKLTYNKILEGWFLELVSEQVKVRLYISVINSKGCELFYEAVLIERGASKQVISFNPVYRDLEGKFLIKISKIDDPHVQEVAKYVVEEISKKIGDKFHYVCIIEAWYLESGGPNQGNYHMYIAMKDSKGFEVIFELNVTVSGKSKNVISFHPVRRDPEGKFLIKISKIDDPHVQEVAKYVVEEISKKIGDKFHYVCIIEAWYLEYGGPNQGKYHMYIAVKDSKGFEVSFELNVTVIGKSKNVISFHPVCRDPEGKFWIKISKINDPHVQEVAKFAVEENNKKNGDELYYKSTVEGWYLKVDQVTSQLYWLHVEVKDCLGRVRKFKTIVKEEKKCTVKVLTLQYFGLIKG